MLGGYDQQPDVVIVAPPSPREDAAVALSISATEQVRASVDAPDPDPSVLPRHPCAAGIVVRVGAWSDAPSVNLVCRVAWFDAGGGFLGVSASVMFASDAAPAPSPIVQFPAEPQPDAWFPACGAAAFTVQVVAVSGGTWGLVMTAG